MRILILMFFIVIYAGISSCNTRQTTHRKLVVDSLEREQITTRPDKGRLIVVGVNESGELFYREYGGRDTISRFIQYSDLDSIIKANINKINATKDRVYFSICECPNFKKRDLDKLVSRFNGNGIKEFGIYRNRPCPK